MRNRWFLILLATAMLNSGGFLPDSRAEADPLKTGVSGFTCSNLPVAQAMRNLSASSPVPLSIVIDIAPQPFVTIEEKTGSLGDILKAILASLPGYELIPYDGTLLVLPKSMAEKEVWPLSKKLPRFQVTYRSFIRTSTGQTNYWCDFYHPDNPPLNIAFGGMSVRQKPNYPAFPYVRTFENLSPLQILTILSKEERQSWSCSRVRPEYVRSANRDIAERHMGPTWWPNLDAPCYVVFYGPSAPNWRENDWYSK